MKTDHHIYTGSMIYNNVRTELSTVRLNKRPAHCGHLSGLLDLFRNKINCPNPVDTGPSLVNVRFSYELDDWTSHAWTQVMMMTMVTSD